MTLRTLWPLLAALLCLDAAAAPVEGMRGMVVSAHPLATQAGLTMLRQGGNAADAAAATAFALAVVEPSASGLGGGGFALTRFRKQLDFMDFRETAPKAATRGMFQKPDGTHDALASRDGALAAGVPGAVAGYLELQRSHGRLARAQVLAPAIRLTREGFPVDERYRFYAVRRLAELARDPEAAGIFLVPGRNGGFDVPPWGHRIVQKDLGRTLEAISRHGMKAFYGGEIADRLAADMKRRGGLVTADDLAAYRVRHREPLVGSYRGHTIATAPPPSAGGHIVLSLLAAVEGFPPTVPRNDASRLAAYVAASRQVYADRVLFGDPAFVPDPTPQLTRKDRLQALVQSLPVKAAEKVVPGAGSPLAREEGAPADEGHNTTHLSVVDAEGNAVAMTTTVNYWFGAAIVAAGTGVLWNDQMDDFATSAGAANAWSLVGSSANAVAPGKIPLSSMSPTLVFAGESTADPLELVIGAPGGPRIPMQVAQAIDARLTWNEDVAAALALPRIHHQWMPDSLFCERFALDPATMRLLEQAGYRIEEETEHRRWGNGMAIAIDPVTGLRTGAADPRGIGTAAAE